MKMSRIEKKFVNSRRRSQGNIRLVDRLVAFIDLTDINKVLEIGCGAGAIAAHLSNKYQMDVIGTDLDPEMIAMARKYHETRENLSFAEADATKLPFVNDEFDLVISVKVLHHIGDWRGALTEIGRVLKPNGLFLFDDLAGSRLVARILRGVAEKYGVYTLNDIISFLERDHFAIVHEQKPRGIVLKHCSAIFQKGYA